MAKFMEDQHHGQGSALAGIGEPNGTVPSQSCVSARAIALDLINFSQLSGTSWRLVYCECVNGIGRSEGGFFVRGVSVAEVKKRILKWPGLERYPHLRFTAVLWETPEPLVCVDLDTNTDDDVDPILAELMAALAPWDLVSEAEWDELAERSRGQLEPAVSAGGGP
ncbi:MAG: hypothetical protein LBG11_04870 [Bifidobacteriaceae bacterium]|jgi:hypothetical protein|nr:hypothetical protein [Bifidobacteriaceae bacterium]